MRLEKKIRAQSKPQQIAGMAEWLTEEKERERSA